MRLHYFSQHALLAALACTASAHAAPVVVGTGTPASCTEAALDAALVGSNQITFNCGAVPHTITLTGMKAPASGTTLDGGGLVTLDANLVARHFYMNSGTYALAGLTLVNGQADHGGAIYANNVTLSLSNVTLRNNRTLAGGDGGALFTGGNLGSQVTLQRVRAIGNRADYGGGAIYANSEYDTLALNEFVAQNNISANGGGAIDHHGAALTITQSLFQNNSSTASGSSGGAVNVDPITSSTLSITNTTFVDNSLGDGSGSALSITGVAGGSIANSTFANNSGTVAISVWAAGTQVTARNTLISATLGGINCNTQGGAVLFDGGNNLQFGGTAAQSCGASMPQADPLLAPLANNGAGYFSQTMALQPGSPAIDAGSGCEVVDQRGVARPIGLACDIGAFEAPVAAPPGNGAIAVPALDCGGLALLSTLLAGLGALRRRKVGLL
ncbi:hypothetical protein GmRootA79_43010 [Acidovorax sp. A79]|uniref:IPTL-CTERM sorting domain-containing protein n=1 Tax=Acidovorax sp. A79 TaxID=3056107 RepID=UPI0034E8CD04